VANRTTLRSSQPEISVAPAAAITLKRRQTPLGPKVLQSGVAVAAIPPVAPKRRQSPTGQKAAAATLAAAEPLPAGRVMPVAFRGGAVGAATLRRVLCYGDSLTVGFCANGQVYEPYGRMLAKDLAASATGVECEVLVSGHSGLTAAEMVAYMDNKKVQDVASRHGKGLRRILREESKPELALIMAGTNDLGKGRQPAEIFKDICRLHAECHALGVRTVVLSPPAAPFAKSSSSWDVSRRRLKELLTSWAQSTPFVAALVDPSELVPPAAAGAWDPDRLHFSPAGSKLLGRRLAPLVLPLLFAKPAPAGAASEEIRVAKVIHPAGSQDRPAAGLNLVALP